jgi:hypothetical protein
LTFNDIFLRRRELFSSEAVRARLMEEIMTALSWNMPVKVNMPHSGMQTIHGPFAALILLMDEWPNMSGPAYVEARSRCRAALDGRKPPEEAREQFLLASAEANVLMIPQLSIA